MLRCTSTISKLTIQKDGMRTSLTFPTTSREPSLSKADFFTAKDMTMKNHLDYERYVVRSLFHRENETAQ